MHIMRTYVSHMMLTTLMFYQRQNVVVVIVTKSQLKEGQEGKDSSKNQYWKSSMQDLDISRDEQNMEELFWWSL